ncbi:hypothetical protein N7532_008825 [Penicillium argentinense]|uniref:Uncharacterized protein n=1 Tax=Penicillium argentinense TaxID=1131581 RepID=A0A9W9EYC0_9EURO|nr:uncharacterized protein N7532_008825 [Penicillium argentinense]KAJ5090141.1 hypothetical protein N7532_008825 [Penicillium argentinense]
MGNPNLASSQTEEKQSIPPPYSPPDPTPANQANISTSASRNGSIRPGDTVAADECIIHLKLLSTIANLRKFIKGTDRLFGIHDSEAKNFSDPRKQSQAVTRLEEKRWAVYVARAVDRFTVWWQTCLPNLDTRNISSLSKSEAKIAWPASMMPPLDVLMVWHAYMLNPRAFLEDCLRQSKMSVWATGMPWEAVNASIDDETFDFYPGKESKINFETQTGLHWNNLADSPTKSLLCSNCKHEISIIWTEGGLGCDPDVAFAHCTGYADKSLRYTCPTCKFRTTHDTLCIQKFRNDLQKLLKDDTPMPGTLLSATGTAIGDEDERDYGVSFPNRLIKDGIRSELLQATDLTQHESTILENIRDRLEGHLKDRSLIRRVNKSTLVPRNSNNSERISLRNMLSRYWENPSPFAINLIGAVIRQGTFLEKMDQIGWIRLSTVRSTMDHFIKKYGVFFQIISKNKGHAVVPTLDVDLIWHTHQLSPARYYSFSTTLTEGIFINHDDKVDEYKLNDAFAWTSKQYQKLTGGQVYSECICWYCSAVREAHTEGLSRLMSSSASQAKANAALLHEKAGNNTPHISSHNAVRIQAQIDPKVIEAQNAKLKSNWEKAQKRSRHSGNDGDMTGKPYTRDSNIHPESYPCNPVCVSTTSGAVGDCISGTYGAGIEQGACLSGPVAAQTRGRGKSFCAGIAGCGMNL